MSFKNWKKHMVFTSFILFVIVLSACGGSSEDAATESEGSNTNSDGAIELVVNSWFAPGQDVPENVWEPWKEYVEEKTEGKVQVTIHYNGALAGSSEILEGVQSGLFDVGMALGMYYADDQLFPLTIGDLPFGNDGDPDKVAKIIQEFSAEYEDMIWDGIIKVGVGATPPRYIYSTSPIESVNFLDGKSVRVSNETETELFKAMGAVPTEVAFEEAYNALDKGMIHAMISSHDVYTGVQFVDPAPNFLNNPVAFTQGTAVMNEGFFNSLPEDLQTLFVEDLNPKWEELFAENARKVMANDQEVIEIAEANGGVVTIFTEEEMKEFQEFGKPVWEHWVELANQRGYPGEEMMENFIRIAGENGLEFEFLD